MAYDFITNHRFLLIAGFLAFSFCVRNVTAQQAIPDSIQLEEETVSVPVVVPASAPVSGPVFRQASYFSQTGSRFVPVSDSVMVPAQDTVVMQAAQAPATVSVPAQASTQTPAQVPVQVPAQVSVPAPSQVYAPAPSMGVPVYTPDGTAPVMDPALAGVPVVDEFAGMEPPCEGLFLQNYCAPFCAPTCNRLLGPGRLFVEGYVAQGFNVNSNTYSYNEPTAVNDKEGYQLNQLYFSIGREVCRGDQWSFGGRVDVMFGTDYYYMTSTGLETTQNNAPHWNGHDGNTSEYRAGREMYGMALPQAYMEAYVPIFHGVDVKVGHFHSVMGFESNQANQNFFYSRSYTSVYGMPTTMTGVMSDWRVTECWSIIAGAVNEWNSFDTPEDNFSFVIGTTYENACGNVALSAVVMSGQQSAAGFQSDDYRGEGANTTVFDIFAKFRLTDRMAYVVEFNYGTSDNDVYDMTAGNTFNGRNWYGFSNYLFYCVSDTLTLGARFEWFHDKENTLLGGGYNTTFANMGVNYFSWTFGANWDPMPWLTIRPEVRWDYCDMELDIAGETYYAYDRNTANYQFTIGCDAIIRF
ncbi:MAG: outer membrane beta-barrel protein [Planctomycetia bacterium]|nr:outer membrane beta-barrel protein [Planctomycetia bacterium]